MTPIRIWILISALLVASGWILSACHALNRAGYGVVFLLTAVGLIAWQRRTGWRPNFGRLRAKFRKRFKRAAPLLFLALAVMCFVGPCLYVNQNNDSSEYRIPRVWHWLAEGQWHWIRTMDIRSNVAGCGYEWLCAPIMLFTRTDRLIFLPNWVSYLMLPGLIYSVFTRLGVRAKVAWWWMWLISSAWCYVFQAGSTMNDSLGVIYALASVDLALRARQKNYLPDLWLAVLALGLLTGVKQTNLPLILPGLAAILYCFPMLIRRPLTTSAVCLASLLASAAPLFYLTFHYTGEWSVNSVTAGAHTLLWTGYDVPPFWGFIGNIFCLTAQNLHPPIFPWADRWNAAMVHFLQTPFGSHFSKFEHFGKLQDGAEEANAGIGLWIVLLTGISVLAAALCREAGPPVTTNGGLRWLRWIPFLSLVIFMAKDGAYNSARQMGSYYVLLFPALLVASGHGVLVRKNWWRGLVLASMVLTAGMVVVARNRPMFPAQTILAHLKEKYPHSHFLARLSLGYSFQSIVRERRAAFDNEIPNERVIGYATGRGAEEAGKWVPFGRRTVVRVLPTDTPAQLQSLGIHYVLVDSEGLTELNTTIDEWTNQLDGVLVGVTNFPATPETMGCDYLVRLNPPVKSTVHSP